MTLSKIAKLAHVSVSTVSKAFSESNEINGQTRDEIFRVAKELGCFKKYYNAKYPKFVIAVICPEFNSGHYSSALSFIEKYLSDKNCEICVAETDFSKEKQVELLNYYNLYTSVDGIIIIGGQAEYANCDIPIVTIGISQNRGNGFAVLSAFYEQITQAVKYFKSKNVTEIGFIGEEKTESKLIKFKESMKEIIGDVNENFIAITDKRFEEGGYSAMEKLFANSTLPRAIICAYDNMAVGAIRCIFDHGFRVPNDIAVMGMDNNRESPFLNPSLSSIDLELEKSCKIASDTIINILNGISTEKEYTVEGKLILRESTNIT